MDAQDHDLLARFRNRRDESAFRQLVDRHIGLVFALSLRVTGSREQAEEIAQTTFARLADKSEGITRETVLAGWLYQTARRLALSAVRSDSRRRQREQIAAAMNFNEPGPSVVAEHLESAMDQLKPEDRDALVLRFFEDRNLRDVGLELGLTEDAARMRVNRALEKLRGIFGKLGIAGSIAWLTTTLPTSASATVPIGLAATITTAVLSGAAIVTTATITHGASTAMNILNLKTGAAILAAAAITGTSTYLVKERDADRLQRELQAANDSRSQLAADKNQAAAAIKLRDDQIAQLKEEVADLPPLRGDVDALHRQLEELAKLRAQNDQLKKENLLLTDERSAEDLKEANKNKKAWKILEPRRLSEMVDTGSATPEAAMQTLLWASKHGRWDKVADMVSLPPKIVDASKRDGKLSEDMAHFLREIVYNGAKKLANLSGEVDGLVWLENGGTTRMKSNQNGQTFDYANVVDFRLSGSPDPSDPRATRFTDYYFTQAPEGWKLVLPGISPEIKAR